MTRKLGSCRGLFRMPPAPSSSPMSLAVSPACPQSPLRLDRLYWPAWHHETPTLPLTHSPAHTLTPPLSLSSSRFMKTIVARHKNGPLVLKIFIKPDANMTLRVIQRRLKSKSPRSL